MKKQNLDKKENHLETYEELEKEIKKLFDYEDLTNQIDPKLINCKNWAKPGIASY